MHPTHKNFSIRTYLYITVTLMGILGLLLALATGNIYREVTLNNNQQIITNLVNRQLTQLSDSLAEEMRELATSLISENEFSHKTKSNNKNVIQDLLTKQFQRQFSDEGQIKLTGIAIYSVDFSQIQNVIKDDKAPERNIACKKLLTEATTRTGIHKTKTYFTYCNYKNSPYFALLTPIGGLRPYAFLYLESDPSPVFPPLRNSIGLPIQIMTDNNKLMYESDEWEESHTNQNTISFDYALTQETDSPKLQINVANNNKSLNMKLEKTRNAVMLIALLVTLITALIITWIIQTTVVTPIRTLSDQLKSLKIDRKQLGKRVSVSGNSEVNILASEFNSMTVELSEAYSELEIFAKKEKNSNDAKSAFLANMTHEIRTPLTAIIGFSKVLQSGNPSPEKLKKSTNIIVKNSEHLLQIINDILDLSKIEENMLEISKNEISLYQLLQDVNNIIAQSILDKKLSFVIHYTYPLPKFITTDEIRLKQILINLLANAKKFTDKGHVYLYASYTTESNTVNFCVEDTGIGLSSSQQKTIFNAFTQADSSTTKKFGGTGLGLSISRILSQKLGHEENGELVVKSELGHGSQFSFSIDPGEKNNLTLCSDLNSFIVEDELEYDFDNQLQVSGNILLVEDTIDNQELIGTILKDVGASVSYANNGQEALDLCQEEVFDLILMDMQMPIMGGLEAVTTLRSRDYNGAIVMLTANAFEKEKQACISAGCDNFLMKPLDINALFDNIEKYLTPLDVSLTSRSIVSTISPEKNTTLDDSIIVSTIITKNGKFKNLVEIFAQKLPDFIRHISEALDKNDIEQLTQHVHQLKGVGGNYGFIMITDVCIIIEDKIHEKEYGDIPPCIDELQSIYAKIIAGLDHPSESSNNIKPK